MKVKGTSIVIELDGDDLAHLIKGGSTRVSDPDSDVQATVQCKDSATVNVTLGDSEETNDD